MPKWDSNPRSQCWGGRRQFVIQAIYAHYRQISHRSCVVHETEKFTDVESCVRCNLLGRRKVVLAVVNQLVKEITIFNLEVGNRKIRFRGINFSFHSSVDLVFQSLDGYGAHLTFCAMHVVAKGSRNVKQTGVQL
jgi:hypothetical protein